MSTEPAENNFQTEDSLSARTRYRDLVVRIWPYMSRYKVMFFGLTAVVIAHTAVGRVLPNLIGYAVDKVILPKKMEMLVTVCLIYLGLEIVRFVFVLVETYYFQLLGQRVIYDMRSDFYSHIQRLPVPFFDKNPVGRLVTRVTNDFGSLADLFTAGLVSVFTDTIGLVAVLVAMSLISMKLTLIVMAVSPIMLWISIKLSQKAIETLRKIKKRLAVINSYVAENISGMKVIQLYGRETKQIQRFNRLSADYRDIQLQNLKYLAWLYPLLNGFNAITVTLALYYGGLLKGESALGVGSLIAFLAHVQDFLPPLRNILEKYQTFQTSLASAERIFSFFDVEQEKIEGQNAPARIMGHIEFKNVTFAYDKSVGPVLRDVSFEIKPGQSVAIVGATGSGKSTIVNLLQRFYEIDPTQGSSGNIFLDGLDIRSLNKLELRRRLGVVAQDYFVFRGTIQSNISLNDPQIGPEKIRQAALRANCEELLKSHEGGLAAIIQERGANLSTGEKQLISFARLLAFNPDILILDEATAHIDSRSEQLVQQATREVTRDRTSIIIAHRLSTILECDKILVLEGGRLVEQGNHAELVSRMGNYQKLYSLQLSKQINQ
jgi:ATP-binding cassette, subfamily B, multidrug efflux pump